MKKDLLLLLLMPLMLSPGCSSSPSQDLPPTMIWNKDQNWISPASGTMNIWGGFSIKKDYFAADRDSSQFILWRNRAGKIKVLIDYSLQGQKAKLAVNFRQRKTLLPALTFKREEFMLDLSRGFNFLEFNKKSKDVLKIRSIDIGGRREGPEPHLLAGQCFSLFLLPGRGKLELSGRGTVEIVQEQTVGETPIAKSEELQSGFFSRKISRNLVFPGPGLLTVKVKKGRFNISSYSFVPIPVKEANPNITFKNKPNIYIVLSDACQASHLGTYGYSRDTSPHIDAFARDAMIYENAYANAVFTHASVSTIFTGFFPDSHKVNSFLTSLPNELLTLPEFLHSMGYATSVITASYVTSPQYGFTQGVDSYFRIKELDKSGAPKGISIFNQFSSWLEKAPPIHFAYMHYMHPHFPMIPPAGFPVTFSARKQKTTLERMNDLTLNSRKTGRLRSAIPLTAEELQEITDAYDSSIAWVDSEFGKFLSLLKAKKLYDDSMIIFLADHGEALGEHGSLSHSTNVYEETSRVPLIIKYPKILNLKGRVRQLTELVDMFPTFVSLFGQRLILDGRNLLARNSNKELDEHIVVSRTVSKSPEYGLRWKNWYYMIQIGNNSEKLFALTMDPYREVGSNYPAVKAFLKARFLTWYSRFRNSSGNAAVTSLKKLPASQIEEMKTLGYL